MSPLPDGSSAKDPTRRGDAGTRPLSVELRVSGMTTIGCARRVEHSLNRLDGVRARVDYAAASATAQVELTRADVGDLVEAVRAAGYRAEPVMPGDGDGEVTALAPAHEEQARIALRNRTVAAAAISVALALLGDVPALRFDGWQWVAFTLATPVVTWAAVPLHRAALDTLKRRRIRVEAVGAFGLIATYVFSVVALLFGPAGEIGAPVPTPWRLQPGVGLQRLYFDVAALVTTILLGGRYFEARAKAKTGRALAGLLRARPTEARRVGPDGGTELVPVGELRAGDHLLVGPFDLFPADGMVVDGASGVDESLLSGEPAPVDKLPGDSVTGATRNLEGTVTVRLTRVGDATTLARIARLVVGAQRGRSRAHRRADRISEVLAPLVAVVALGAFAGWLVAHDLPTALKATIAVVIVACPCALSLAAPSALLIGTGRGAQLGLLIRGPQVLQTTRDIDTVVLDKTGTLTTGRMEVEEVVTAEGIPRSQALRLIGSVEAGSDHLIARAIVRAAEREVGQLPPQTGFAARGGLGASAIVADREVVVGRLALLTELGLTAPSSLATVLHTAERRGRTAVAAGWYGEVRAVVVLADPPKPGVAAAVARLRALGLRPLLLTGDNRHAALSVADHVGIDRADVIAEMLPGGKAGAVAELQAGGAAVAVVGDAITDAPALAGADLGITIGTGNDLAVAAGDLTVVGGDPAGIADAIELSRATLHTIRRGLRLATALTVLALPSAAFGLLSPLAASLVMAGASVLVVASALPLRSWRPSR